MLEISPGVVLAFEREHGSAERRRFPAWWQAQSPLLAAASPDYLRELLLFAQERGAEIGIEGNADNRQYLLAAALSLYPQMTAEQFLLVTDALFEPASDRDRLIAIHRAADEAAAITAQGRR